MTPAARAQAATVILDDIAAGRPLEPALLTWARGNRYAGSKDRAAIRDIVFSIMRRRASCAAMGGGMAGRALLRGFLAQEGIPEAEIFGQGPYAPPPLTPEDAPLKDPRDLTPAERADLQPWLWAALEESHPEAGEIAEALRHRAPVWLRLDDPGGQAAALESLTAAGHAPEADPRCPGAIRITARERQLAQHPLLTEGGAELQDLGPQRALAALPTGPGATALDFCAGGGGKALALAARGMEVTAHDADPGRMADLPRRAARAGVRIAMPRAVKGTYDLVLCDVPCSGSGAWRRAPANKWTLTPEDLSTLVARQRSILTAALRHIRPGGTLAYMTCSLLPAENDAQAAWLAERLGQTPAFTRQYTPLDGCDGFYIAVFGPLPEMSQLQVDF
ncbi:MAG: RsmB/NOP family class I SAM-dependent RNA methyltransferase [Pseudomonadota bacterium]